jgi:catechol 2,3-dioxygenase-like lactoylglutathione lyase family enzyme
MHCGYTPVVPFSAGEPALRFNARQLTTIVILVALIGCGRPVRDENATQKGSSMGAAEDRNIIANNVFFYYADLETAGRFYGEVLGLQTVADYGFAKMLRVAETSYLTLVDAESGMHPADEPKTVALALITDQLDEWYDYVMEQSLDLKYGYNPKPGSAHDGFVVVDPEGYYLEFERFNHHPENEHLMPILDALEPVFPDGAMVTTRPSGLGFKATVVWLYGNDVEAMRGFYEDVFGFELIVDQGWAKILATSPTGFIGPVDGTRGMHSWTERKGVTVSFITDDVDAWFEHLRDQPAFELRTPEVIDESRAGARIFVGSDPDGYFVELDQFFQTDGNESLIESLSRSTDRR